MKRDARTDTPNFWGYARNYLHEYMPKARGLSPKTIEAYRISLESFVDYLVGERHIAHKDIGFDHFERRFLKDWLIWMRVTKNYQPKTLNLRLTAIKAFLQYASREDLRLVALHEAAKTLKAPALAKKPIEYLEQNETTAILAAFDGSSMKSRRNRMLLILLYESAARISELTGLTLGDLKLAPPAHLTLTGKGNKSRLVPWGTKPSITCRSISTNSILTGQACRQRVRCSTVSTTENPPGSPKTASRRSSRKPGRSPVNPVPRSPSSCTAT
ncbi:tyrosine-type recombinase/integrase [Paenarthrobacter sp. PH39-S1]|nr:tyrosine-type recombinase/integrase [Paenarthrobacter sp. PH39-S1]MDJ0358139.1 tyrosine-type recombinase/integrase [Paenarthrobacter sp. PH39-S1]